MASQGWKQWWLWVPTMPQCVHTACRLPGSSAASVSPQWGQQPRAEPGTEEQRLSRGSLFAAKRESKCLWWFIRGPQPVI